jgi:hypothetical protein
MNRVLQRPDNIRFSVVESGFDILTAGLKLSIEENPVLIRLT